MGLSQADIERISRLFELYKKGLISREELESSKEAIQSGARPSTAILKLSEISTRKPTVELEGGNELVTKARQQPSIEIQGRLRNDTAHYYRNSKQYYTANNWAWSNSTALSWFAFGCLASFFVSLGIPALFSPEVPEAHVVNHEVASECEATDIDCEIPSK